MSDESLEQRAQRLEKENGELRGELEKIRAQKKRRMLTSNFIQPIITRESPRDVRGPSTTPRKKGKLIQSHGRDLPTPEQRHAEILEKVQRERMQTAKGKEK